MPGRKPGGGTAAQARAASARAGGRLPRHTRTSGRRHKGRRHAHRRAHAGRHAGRAHVRRRGNLRATRAKWCCVSVGKCGAAQQQRCSLQHAAANSKRALRAALAVAADNGC